MRDHTKLRAFEVADQLALSIYQCTNVFPPHERYGLNAQMRRCAVSVASNIVEGCARSSQQEYIRFLEIAYGSSRELEYQLTLASRLGYVAPDQKNYYSASEECSKVLNGLIRSLHQQRIS